MKMCSVAACDKAKRPRGAMCSMHEARARKSGSPLVTSRLVGVPVVERLLHRTRGGDFTTCWIWQGAANNRGYGVIRVAGRLELVHRVAYAEFVGAIPADLTLDHLCNTPLCLNPWHLEPVPAMVNSQRAAARRVAVA